METETVRDSKRRMDTERERDVGDRQTEKDGTRDFSRKRETHTQGDRQRWRHGKWGETETFGGSDMREGETKRQIQREMGGQRDGKRHRGG